MFYKFNTWANWRIFVASVGALGDPVADVVDSDAVAGLTAELVLTTGLNLRQIILKNKNIYI